MTAVTFTDQDVRIDAAGGTAHADELIVAVPPPLAVEQIAFSPPLPAELRSAAEQTMVWMGQTVKAVAAYDQPFWRSQGLADAAMSYAGPFREFHDHSGPAGLPPAIFGFAPAESFVSSRNEDIAQAFRAQFARLFGPEAERTRDLLVVDWSRETFTSPRHPLLPPRRTAKAVSDAGVRKGPLGDD